MNAPIKIVNADVPQMPVRRMDFSFAQDIPRLWFGEDAFRTALLSALSCTFPEGERMFMRAVRHFQDGVASSELQKRVRAFIGQEANHGKEHEAFNQFLAQKGLPSAAIEDFVRKGIAKEESFFSPERMLAKTCALEHFTALFAERVLSHPEILEDMDPRLIPLWLWHAIEESEHKSVAFDVYQDQVGSYWIRSSEMLFTTLLFTLFTTLHTRQMLAAMAGEPHGRGWRHGLRSLFGQRGFLRGMLPRYLDYFRPNFHPDQHDTDALREKGLALLARYQQALAEAEAA